MQENSSSTSEYKNMGDARLQPRGAPWARETLPGPHSPGRAAAAPWKPLKKKAEPEWGLKRRKKIRRRLFPFSVFCNSAREVGRGGVPIADTETKADKNECRVQLSEGMNMGLWPLRPKGRPRQETHPNLKPQN